MGFNCGIVGLPNVGKSTLFNALTRVALAQAANYPFCTIEPNVGRVAVPDDRLDRLQTIIGSAKQIPTFMEFVDIAGLVRGASRGEGLGNQFLGHIRQVDAIIHVVRCFEDSNIIHVDGDPDPIRDLDTINTELIYADSETVRKSKERLQKQLKNNDKKVLAQYACAELLEQHLVALKPARTFMIPGEEEEAYIKSLHLMSQKPMLYAANLSELDFTSKKENHLLKALREYAVQEETPVIGISARFEEELTQLEPEEAKQYLIDFGCSESGLERLIQAGYQLLGLQTYFTAGPQESRAWTIPKGCKAPQAAGVIHTDFEKGFICAEVYHCVDLFRLGSEVKLKEAGLLRKEGKEYVCQDGDVVHFLFNL